MREGLQRKYERQVDPEGVLPPEERARRADAAYRADKIRWSRKAVKARAARKSPAPNDDSA